jgi:hypothetical protein
MISKIIQHKTRNGILAFFTGLLVAIIALYIDVFRGDNSGTIGIYQIIGALIGYMFSGIGVVLIMKEVRIRKAVQNIVFIGGGTISIISIFSDYIGVAGALGFDKFQTAGTILGVLILLFGVYVLPQRVLNRRKRDG